MGHYGLRHSNFVNPGPDHQGILILDLRTAKVSQQAVRHWTRKRVKKAKAEEIAAEITENTEYARRRTD